MNAPQRMAAARPSTDAFPPGLALRHGAKAAATRADVAQDHERGRLAGEALVNVGATRGLADGMAVAPAQVGLERVQRGEVHGALAQPFRQAFHRAPHAGRDLDEVHVRSAAGENAPTYSLRSIVSKPSLDSFDLNDWAASGLENGPTTTRCQPSPWPELTAAG